MANQNPSLPVTTDERKALQYGQVELIPGIRCDAYILTDGSAVLSGNGFADFLGITRQSLNSMSANWPSKTLEPFTDKGSTMATTLVKVEAETSPYKGQEIVAYDVQTVEGIIHAYALAYAHGCLRENQLHIGQRTALLLSMLVHTSLFTMIEVACGLKSKIKKAIERYYRDRIFTSVIDLLWYALRFPYPDRETQKYQNLMATCFKYAYEQYLGKEGYKTIKENKPGRHPVHQYIHDQITRRRCVCYLALLATYVIVRGCRIAEAKEAVSELMKKLIEAGMPGLVPQKNEDRQLVFDFMQEPIEAPASSLVESCERTALYYGEVSPVPAIKCDGYIFSVQDKKW